MWRSKGWALVFFFICLGADQFDNLQAILVDASSGIVLGMLPNIFKPLLEFSQRYDFRLFVKNAALGGRFQHGKCPVTR